MSTEFAGESPRADGVQEPAGPARARGLRLSLELPLDLLASSDVIALARLAEATGVDTVWLQEGVGRDAVSLAGALARATSTLKIATGPVDAWTRTPYLLAMSATTLDELTGGRFILGLTPGHDRRIATFHGMELAPIADAGSRIREVLTAIRALLTGDTVTMEGRFVRMHGARLPTTPRGGVPLHLNARRTDVLEAAGALADGVLLSIAPADWVRDVALPHIAIGAAAAGRQPAQVDVAWHPVMCIDDDEALAVAAAAKVLGGYFENDEVLHLLRMHGFAEDVAALERARERGADPQPSERLVGAIALAGTPATVRAQIAEHAGAGVGHLIVRAHPVGIGSPRAAIEAALEQLKA